MSKKKGQRGLHPNIWLKERFTRVGLNYYDYIWLKERFTWNRVLTSVIPRVYSSPVIPKNRPTTSPAESCKLRLPPLTTSVLRSNFKPKLLYESCKLEADHWWSNDVSNVSLSSRCGRPRRRNVRGPGPHARHWHSWGATASNVSHAGRRCSPSLETVTRCGQPGRARQPELPASACPAAPPGRARHHDRQ